MTKEPVKQPAKVMAVPAWLTRDDGGAFHVDPSIAYPAFLKALGIEKPDQYWLEVAFQCVKLKVQDIAALMGHDGKLPLRIIIGGGVGNKKSWALVNHPPGRGSLAATKGREARDHYERIRGLI